jgi:hypothetical protein
MHAYVGVSQSGIRPTSQRGPRFPRGVHTPTLATHTTQTRAHTLCCCKVRLTIQSAANQRPSPCFTPRYLSSLSFSLSFSLSPCPPVLSTHSLSPCPSWSLLSHPIRSHRAHPTKGPVLVLFCRCRDPPASARQPRCIASLTQSPRELQSSTHLLVE